jgi:hypothetical protein
MSSDEDYAGDYSDQDVEEERRIEEVRVEMAFREERRKELKKRLKFDRALRRATKKAWPPNARYSRQRLLQVRGEERKRKKFNVAKVRKIMGDLAICKKQLELVTNERDQLLEMSSGKGSQDRGSRRRPKKSKPAKSKPAKARRTKSKPKSARRTKSRKKQVKRGEDRG